MKNMTRKRFVEMSILCLMVASSGRLFAQGAAKQGAKSIGEQAPGEAASVSNATPESANETQVRVGPGDLLEVRVFDNPELTQTVRVSDVGDASLNLIG